MSASGKCCKIKTKKTEKFKKLQAARKPTHVSLDEKAAAEEVISTFIGKTRGEPPMYHKCMTRYRMTAGYWHVKRGCMCRTCERHLGVKHLR
jgi:hypothetical protein